MTNIWRFSLVLAFSIIFDQVLKGVAQGFVASNELVKLFGNIYFGEFKKPIMGPLENAILYTAYIIVIILVVRSIILNRHKNIMIGLSLTFILTSLFSTFLDRLSHGYIVNYFKYDDITFSYSSLLLSIGLVLFTIFAFQEEVR